jgi:hypothetical protein
MVMDIYVAKSDGVWLYDPQVHSLHRGPSILRRSARQKLSAERASLALCPNRFAPRSPQK